MDAATPTDRSGLPRRAVLKGLGVAGLTAAALPALGTSTATAAAPPGPDLTSPAADGTWLQGFVADVRAEFARQGVVGGGVALVRADRVIATLPLGVRTAGTNARVDADTRFVVASLTKSMSTLQVATWVDEGLLSWDQPAKDVWPDFQAPTPELTATLRVRDLLGMGSGLVSPVGGSEDLHQQQTTARQVVHDVVNQVVAGPVDTVYNYNNNVFVTGSYLPQLKRGVKDTDLTGTWAVDEQQRVWTPAGMTSTFAADDPRERTDDYATGYCLDLSATPQPSPFVGPGSSFPAGGAVTTLNDLASYVRLQLRGGRSVTGRRVVSAANLDQTHRPHVTSYHYDPANPIPFEPDLRNQGYCMGWLANDYADGTRLVWHNGSLDGFTAYVGFIPSHDIGLAVVSSMNAGPTGFWFYQYVQNLLLNRYGINNGGTAAAHQAWQAAVDATRTTGSTARRVPAATAAQFVGRYEEGYVVDVVRGELVAHLGQRSWTIKQVKGGGFVVADGLLVGLPVVFSQDPDGVPRMLVAGHDSVRRTALL